MIETRKSRLLIAAFVIFIAHFSPASAQDRSVPPPADRIQTVAAEHGMVVAQEKIAAQIGGDILRQGGNAIDAAVATGFAMAVTYPRAGNIGGGGFMVIYRNSGEDVAIDYREMAPAAMTRHSFLGPDGKPDDAKSRDSALGIGVPGTVAGLALALDKYGSGKFTLAQLVKPAIVLARDGFVISDDMADTLPAIHARLANGRPRQRFSRARTAPRWSKATGWCRPILPRR